MSRLATIELFKSDMKFSAGHFTVFTGGERRENLHGHNYQVHACMTTIVEEQGMTFDYRFYKDKLRALCDSLDETILMAGNCRFLRIEEAGDYWHVHFKEEKMIFLKRDLTILPVTNITVEELSNYLLQQVLVNRDELDQNKIQKIKLKVISGEGQSGSTTWRRTND